MSLLIKGVSDFLGLADTPVSYTGAAQKQARVNLAEDALEFIVGSKFTTTKLFDGASASPPTIYFTPLTLTPHATFAGATTGIYEFGAVVVGDYIYVFGGQSLNGGASYTNLHYRYNIATGLWEKRASVPTSAGGHTHYKNKCAGYYNGKIYFACLFDGPNFEKKIIEYTIATDSWSAVADFPAQSDIDELWVVCCTDALYLHQSGSSFGGRFDKMDYSTHAWTALANHAGDGRSQIAGIIADDIYAVRRDNLATYKYDKGLNSWADQAQACPLSLSGACFVEDKDEIWIRSQTLAVSIHYKYTPAGGWVSQFTSARHCYPWDWILKRSADGKLYAIWGSAHSYGGQNEPVWGGAIQTYVPVGVWELLTQTFNEGDLLILYEEAGIPVNVEKNGQPLLVGTGMDTVYIVQTGSYYFTLSKDFSLKSVQIWRSVWG